MQADATLRVVMLRRKFHRWNFRSLERSLLPYFLVIYLLKGKGKGRQFV